MQYVKLFGVILVAAISTQSLAAQTTCDSYLGLNRYHYHVDLNRDSNWLELTGENGELYRGSSVYSYSSRLQTHYYYLPFTFDNKGFEIRIDNQGMQFCRKVNECYTCN